MYSAADNWERCVILLKKKKIVAYSAGRRNGNSETYIKAALMAAEEMGVEVELIRLNECNLQPCKACTMQVCAFKGPEACPLNDDAAWLIEKFLDSDGYLLGAPVWALSPNGLVSVFRDRVFGPKMDSATYDIFGGEPAWVKGRVKVRPGALISVGGAVTENWTSLGLATQFSTTFSAQTQVIDHMNVTQVADMGAAVLRDDYLERAAQLGRNLAHSVLHMDEEKPHWMGDDTPTACPGCHLNLMIVHPGTDRCECAICGRFGKVSMKNGGMVFAMEENDPNDRLTAQGKITHANEIFWVKKNTYEPHKEEIPEKWKPYKDYTANLQTPPSKMK